MYPNVSLLIDGAWTPAIAGRTLEVLNPATGEVNGTVAHADRADMDRALEAAEKGFLVWRKVSAFDRSKLMRKAADLLRQRADAIARLMTLEQGKPFPEAKGETLAGADVIDWFAEEARRTYGRVIPARADGIYQLVVKEPVGPVAAFTPWNFPINQVVRKLSAALAAGCSIIVKAPEETPASPAELIRCFVDAGVPAGVVSLLYGVPSEISEYLIPHPVIRKISFTGSTAVGKEIMRAAAETVKKVSLELGGKSPNIVFADADLDAAARGALTGIFYGKGEVCAAGSRLLVEAPVREELQQKILERAKRMVAGDPLNPKTRLGAIVSKAQMERVLSYIESGKREGATLLAGGERTPVNGKGYFVQPTIFGDVRGDMTIAREEIFGPVLAMMSFEGGVEGATAMANDTIYGLAAGIWTRDIKKALRTARAVRAGTVWINTYNMYDAASPFGGFKQSGFGRELGMHALDGYTQVKSVWVDLS